MLAAGHLFDFRVAGDGYVTLSAVTAANTSRIVTAGRILDFRIAGDGYVTFSVGPAADARTVIAALSVFDFRIAGDGARDIIGSTKKTYDN